MAGMSFQESEKSTAVPSIGKKMYRKIWIGSGILMIAGIVIGFIGFPALINYLLMKEVTLNPGSEIRQMWEKLPFPLNFSIYVFNVTNADEVQNGGKPVVKEIGPFVFEEWKDKYNIKDNDTEDTATFNMRNTFIFRPDLGLSGEEVITMPHPILQVMALAVKRDREPMTEMISEGLVEIFHPTSPFISASFMDIFYRGIDVDCSSEKYVVKAICMNFFTGTIKGAVQVNETFFKFSLLGANNHSDAGELKVSRGIKIAGTVGKVLEFDGEEELSNWNGEECNKISGTDSTIFPPLMKRDEALVVFSADLCRSLRPRFEQYTEFDGMPALRYILDFGDVKNETANQCYCKSYPDNCPPKGTLDLSPCNDAPMFASHPHFLNADTQLLEDIDGICPSLLRHRTYVDFEIISGTPLSIARRLQFNLDVQPIKELIIMKDMRRLIMPLFWIEETAKLGPEFTKLLRNKIFLIKNINNAFRWIAVVFGALGCLFSIIMIYVAKKNRITIVETPTPAK